MLRDRSGQTLRNSQADGFRDFVRVPRFAFRCFMSRPARVSSYQSGQAVLRRQYWVAEAACFLRKNPVIASGIVNMARQKNPQKTPSVTSSRSRNEPEAEGGEVENGSPHFPLSQLHLDGNNPRLGAQAGQLTNQVQILDAVVDVFGIDDVLSSLAVNGFFEAEPLVGVRIGSNGGIRIAEGNRRLAACLILAGDERARNHTKRTAEYQALQKRYRQPPIAEVPVRVLSDERSLLSYLGVRHIAAAQPWDSFAKAAWVAKVLEQSDLTLEDVSDMIGDQHRTVARTLEGYYFVNQLIGAAQFNPADSLRPGRGSNLEYPFSWIYTALGFAPIREWLGLADLAQKGRDKQPIQGADKLDEAGELVVFLFGNKSKNRQPAVTESREIADLAKAVANPESRRLLKRGKKVNEVAQLLKPAKERIADCLLDAQESLKDALGPLSQGEIGATEATDLQEPSRRVKNLASEVNKKISEVIEGDGD
jgi:hypothetical protein